MKKLLVMFCLLAVSTLAVQAQSPQEKPGGGRMNEMMKQRLKDEIKLTDVQINSVMAIQAEMQMKNRQLRQDENMNEDQKKVMMDANTAVRKARLKNNLSEEQITKLDAMYEEMRKMRLNRPNN